MSGDDNMKAAPDYEWQSICTREDLVLSTGAVLVAPLGTAARTRAGGMVLEVSGLGAGLELAVAACGGMRCRHKIHTRATLREGECTCKTGRAASGLRPRGFALGPVARLARLARQTACYL